jgi:hypothetical protein
VTSIVGCVTRGCIAIHPDRKLDRAAAERRQAERFLACMITSSEDKYVINDTKHDDSLAIGAVDILCPLNADVFTRLDLRAWRFAVDYSQPDFHHRVQV